MAKLSATTSVILDTEEIPRTDITPEAIRNMTDDELRAFILKNRGNREVTTGTKRKNSAPTSTVSKEPKKTDADEFFGDE
jgi:hypothetical protein